MPADLVLGLTVEARLIGKQFRRQPGMEVKQQSFVYCAFGKSLLANVVVELLQRFRQPFRQLGITQRSGGGDESRDCCISSLCRACSRLRLTGSRSNAMLCQICSGLCASMRRCRSSGGSVLHV